MPGWSAGPILSFFNFLQSFSGQFLSCPVPGLFSDPIQSFSLISFQFLFFLPRSGSFFRPSALYFYFLLAFASSMRPASQPVRFLCI